MADIRQMAEDLVAATSSEVSQLQKQLKEQYAIEAYHPYELLDVRPPVFGGRSKYRKHNSCDDIHKGNAIAKRRKKNKNKKTHRK